MKHIKKALLDTIIMGGMMLIFALFQKSSKTFYGVLFPITGVFLYSFIKAAYFIYNDKKNGNLN